MRATFFAVLLLAAARPAGADPQTFVLSHTGFLLDDQDHPMDASAVQLTVSIWDDPESTVESRRVWPTPPATPPTCEVEVKRGLYATVLGGGSGSGNCGAGLTTAALPLGQMRYLEVSVNGQRMTPRMRIGAAPTAALAGDSERIGGLTLTELDARYPALSLTDLDARYDTRYVPGSVATLDTHFDARYFKLTDGTALEQQIATDLGPSATQTLTHKTIDAADNTLSNITDAEIAAGAAIARSKIAAGTASQVVINDPTGKFSSEPQLSLARGGTGASTAAGAFAALSPLGTKGQILVHDGTSNAGLAVGTNGQVLTADSAAAAGMKWGTISIPPSGSIPQAATPPVACTSSTGGQMYYDTVLQLFRVCNGQSYVNVGTSGAVASQAPETALASCDAIKSAAPGSTNGVYYIDPDGAGNPTQPYQVYCIMDSAIDGGGWMLAFNLDTSDGNLRKYDDTNFWVAGNSFGAVDSTALKNDFMQNEVFTRPSTKLLVLVHREGTEMVGWRSYNLASGNPLKAFFTHSLSRQPGFLTSSSLNSSLASLDPIESTVRPNGQLRVNMKWGAGGSPGNSEIARVRNDALPDTDDAQYGLGTWMDYGTSGDYYPQCEAGTTLPWANYFCIGTDRRCPGNCGNTTGGGRDLEYDYAFLVKGTVTPPDTTASLLGNSSGTAATSCAQIHTSRSTAPTGNYWIDPDGSGTTYAPFEVVCEMSIDGGGWMLAMNIDTSDGNIRSYDDSGFWTTAGGFGTVANAVTNDYKSAPLFSATGYTKILVRVHRENLEVKGWKSWNLATPSSSLMTLLNSSPSTSPTALTSSTSNSDISGLDSVESIVRPSGNLRVNARWGAGGNQEAARIRNDALADVDDSMYGMGCWMDVASGNYYPQCDVGLASPWANDFCIGSDRKCPGNCGNFEMLGNELMYDYGIYVK